MDLLMVYTFWLFILNTGGCFLTWEKEHGHLTPAQRECCSAFLSEDALPQSCFEKGKGCPAFDVFPDQGESKDIQHPGLVVVKSAAAPVLFVLALLLASAIVQLRINWMGNLEAVKRAVCIVQHCVALKATEIALVLVLRLLFAPGDDIFTMFTAYIQFSSTWGISVSVAGILLGTSQLCRVPQLEKRGLYVLIEYIYSSLIFLIVLAATGFTTFANLWACLRGAGLPILVLLIVWGRRRMTRGEAEDDNYWDKLISTLGGGENDFGSR